MVEIYFAIKWFVIIIVVIKSSVIDIWERVVKGIVFQTLSYPWPSIDILGNPQISTDIHGYP